MLSKNGDFCSAFRPWSVLTENNWRGRSNRGASGKRYEPSGGCWPGVRSASVLRFCTMAARWNSSRAPERPLSRIRSKPWWVFKWAKRISTRFRSSRDLANASFSSSAVRHRERPRGCLRASAVVQHAEQTVAPDRRRGRAPGRTAEKGAWARFGEAVVQEGERLPLESRTQQPPREVWRRAKAAGSGGTSLRLRRRWIVRPPSHWRDRKRGSLCRQSSAPRSN
jgi:hypothetical protein